MKKEIICPACKGSGIIEKELRKKADKTLDDWSFKHDGYKYRLILCKKCKGEGFLI
jgi:predicted nucleic-acid-binding Zn-ribbon protein